MFNLGIPEIGTIVVLILLVFGPDRLPEVARNAAKVLARFREETSRSLDELKKAAQVDGLDQEIRGVRDEMGRIRSDVKGFATDLTRTVDQPTRTRPQIAPPFDPDAT